MDSLMTMTARDVGDFLMLKRDERSEPRPIIITNWQRLLRQKSK